MRRMMTAIGLGLSAVLLTSGCQLVGGGGNAKSKPAQTTKSTGGQQAQAAPSPQSSSGTPPVSKQVTLPIHGKQGETFTLGFANLKLKGQLAVLTLVWTPHGIGSDTSTMLEMGDSLYPISMLDKTNLKRYVVVTDSEDNDLQTGISNETGNDQPLTTTFWFAAPPAGADLDVLLADRPVFESIPVTR